MEEHDHWYLDNQLPLPQTICGSRYDSDVVLVRLRSVNDAFLDVSADDTLELVLEQGGTRTSSKVPSGQTLKLRVVEIYYGFSDYVRGITLGCAQQHSRSAKNAYAVCRMLNIPASPWN
jgi:hypothetical protein